MNQFNFHDADRGIINSTARSNKKQSFFKETTDMASLNFSVELLNRRKVQQKELRSAMETPPQHRSDFHIALLQNYLKNLPVFSNWSSLALHVVSHDVKMKILEDGEFLYYQEGTFTSSSKMNIVIDGSLCGYFSDSYDRRKNVQQDFVSWNAQNQSAIHLNLGERSVTYTTGQACGVDMLAELDFPAKSQVTVTAQEKTTTLAISLFHVQRYRQVYSRETTPQCVMPREPYQEGKPASESEWLSMFQEYYFFDKVSLDCQIALLHTITLVNYKVQSPVVLPGDDLQKVYIVYKGSMEIYLQYTPVESVKESKELTYHSEYGILLATLQAGQAFGDRGIFEMHQLPVQYCLVCSEMSELLELSYADYHDICKTSDLFENLSSTSFEKRFTSIDQMGEHLLVQAEPPSNFFRQLSPYIVQRMSNDELFKKALAFKENGKSREENGDDMNSVLECFQSSIALLKQILRSEAEEKQRKKHVCLQLSELYAQVDAIHEEMEMEKFPSEEEDSDQEWSEGEQASISPPAVPLYAVGAERKRAAVPMTSELLKKIQKGNENYLKAKELDQEYIKYPHHIEKEHVIKSYLAVAETYMKILKECTISESQKNNVSKLTEAVIDRISLLRALSHAPVITVLSPLVARRQLDYTRQEIDVLRRSSKVNNLIFLPWMDEDGRENFSFETPFCDPDGLMPLSIEQEEHFVAWRRPHQLPHAVGNAMIKKISPHTITQDVVMDCSFVASLCITSQYEIRFQKQLITCIVFPQNDDGMPIYNRSGKYIVKLWINGVQRKVVVDDRFPVTRSSRLLCSCTTSVGEWWVSVIEKAYMKVNGGYTFPGSNSSFDLFALTGWIPESILLDDRNSTGAKSSNWDRSSTRSAHPNTDPNHVWNRLKSAHEFGDCLITIATGEDDHVEDFGLVRSHAYAVLDVVEVNGHRLLKVKNPWRKQRWTGPFSHQDTENWTPLLCLILKYDVEEARKVDDGLFWIDFTSAWTYFRGLFLNWNPNLFQYRTTLHKNWGNQKGPQNDEFNVGYNPQYSLKVHFVASKKKKLPMSRIDEKKNDLRLTIAPPTERKTKALWILLSRHTTGEAATSKEQDEKQDYLTLHVFTHRGEKRVYFPEKHFIEGTYSNNPHYLTCIDVPEGEHSYTLVVSQYKKVRDLDYTMSVFSAAPFRLSEASHGPNHKKRIQGAWEATTAGGNLSCHSYRLNPQWLLTVTSSTGELLVTCNAPMDYPVNVHIVKSNQRVACISQLEVAGTTGIYRPGFCILELKDGLPIGEYVIIPSTNSPDSLGAFSITLAMANSKCCSLAKIPNEGDQMQRTEIIGKWRASRGTAAGNHNFNRYIHNPRYLIRVTTPTIFFVRLLPHKMDTQQLSLNVSLFKSDKKGSVATNARPDTNAVFQMSSNKGFYIKDYGGAATPSIKLPVGYYVVIPSTCNPFDGRFQLLMFSDLPINVESIVT